MDYEKLSDREIDNLVALKVFGLIYDSGEDIQVQIENCSIKNYSTNISDAWLVVEEMWQRDFRFDLSVAPYVKWQALFGKDVVRMEDYIGEHKSISAPRAICIASLRALSIGKNEG